MADEQPTEREWLEGLRYEDKFPERCPSCGGTDREGGTVVVAGPDEFGNYDTDDCPDSFHD